MEPKFVNLTTVGDVKIILNVNHIIFARENENNTQVLILTSEKEYVTVVMSIQEFQNIITGKVIHEDWAY